jgi:hypothetical protein
MKIKEVRSASDPSVADFNCGGGSSVACKPDPHARNDQIHFERRRGDLRGHLVAERVRIDAVSPSGTRWEYTFLTAGFA